MANNPFGIPQQLPPIRQGATPVSGGPLPRNNIMPSAGMSVPQPRMPQQPGSLMNKIMQLWRMKAMQQRQGNQANRAEMAAARSGADVDYEFDTLGQLEDEYNATRQRGMAQAQPWDQSPPPALPEPSPIQAALLPMQEPEPLPLDDVPWEDDDDLPRYDYPRTYW